MKKIYICSPVRADTPEEILMNKARAVEYARSLAQRGNFPVCVHDFLERITGFKGEETGLADREKLLACGREWVKMCDEVWVFGNTISEGMKKEIKIAESHGIPIRYITRLAVPAITRRKS